MSPIFLSPSLKQVSPVNASSVFHTEEKAKLAKMLSHPGTQATVLHAICLKEFGTDCYEWGAETFAMELEEEFGIEVPEKNINKIMAISCLQVNDQFYTDWPTFHVVVSSLNSETDPFGPQEVHLPAEIAWAVTQAQLNDSGFKAPSREICKYVGTVLAEAGMTTPPPSLSWAVMPEVYRGSDYAADLNQEELQSNAHLVEISEYVQAQSMVLFKQISALPWMTEEILDDVHKNIG